MGQTPLSQDAACPPIAAPTAPPLAQQAVAAVKCIPRPKATAATAAAAAAAAAATASAAAATAAGGGGGDGGWGGAGDGRGGQGGRVHDGRAADHVDVLARRGNSVSPAGKCAANRIAVVGIESSPPITLLTHCAVIRLAGAYVPVGQQHREDQMEKHRVARAQIVLRQVPEPVPRGHACRAGASAGLTRHRSLPSAFPPLTTSPPSHPC